MNIDIKYLRPYNIIYVSCVGELYTPRDAFHIRRKVLAFAEQNSCQKFIYDFRKATLIDSFLDIYNFGENTQLMDVEKKFKIAILFAEEAEKHEFVEKVFIEKNYNIRCFPNEVNAFGWLVN